MVLDRVNLSPRRVAELVVLSGVAGDLEVPDSNPNQHILKLICNYKYNSIEFILHRFNE